MRIQNHFVLRAILVSLLILLTVVGPALAQKGKDKAAERPEPFAAALLIDSDTGQVLFEHNPDLLHIPASLVKIMLMLLVVESVKQGAFSLDEKVNITREASRIGGSQVYLKQGEVFTLGDLLKTVVIASANDSAYAIAEHIAGTPEAMVQLMNERARELGLEKTIFTNVHGLPPGPDQKQDYITAREISVISREIIKHPLLLEWGRTVQDEFRGGKFKLYNTNKLLAHFPGMDGIKTGYHKKAGYNLVASVKRDNLRLLSVVLGAPTQKIRASETRRLLTQGFRVYKKMSFFTGEKPIGKPVDVDHGKKKTVAVKPAKSISLLVKRIHSGKIKTRVSLQQNSITAPVKKGQEVGKAEVVVRDQVLASVPLIATEEVARKTWLDRLMFWKN